ncbi:MAG: 16S rRNA (uracil(1498)-N(3))-methyltransferase [Chloroflexota bacterium]
MAKRTHNASDQPSPSNTYRFFVEAELTLNHEIVIEDAHLLHQLTKVLRLREGSRILLLDNSGCEYTVQLTALDRKRFTGLVEACQQSAGEPHTQVTLFVGMMRAERFEWVLQKGTELGVTTFVPLLSERSIVNAAQDIESRKFERWQRIVREAAEQACRGRLPQITGGVPFAMACERAAKSALAVLLWEGHDSRSLRYIIHTTTRIMLQAETVIPTMPPLSVSLMSGPEGGFTSTEIKTAQDYGVIPATLGRRILRAETAPIVAATAVLYAMGDLE